MKSQNLQNVNHQGENSDADSDSDTTLCGVVSAISTALSSAKKFSGETFVIKFGGVALNDDKLMAAFAQDLILLKQSGINLIVVHDIGNDFVQSLHDFGVDVQLIDGHIVADSKAIKVIEMLLCGSINKRLVQTINNAEGAAIGLSGKDCSLIQAKKLRKTHKKSGLNNVEEIIDMGFVGEVYKVDPDILFILEESDFIPVIAPICGGTTDCTTYYVSADDVATEIARAVSASKLIIFSDDTSLFVKNSIIDTFSTKEASFLLSSNAVKKEMIPIVKNCVSAVHDGCDVAHILNSKELHVLLVKLFTNKNIGVDIIGNDDLIEILDN